MLRQSTIEEQELSNFFLTELTPPQLQKLDENHDMLF
jgi:hypothetical protein